MKLNVKDKLSAAKASGGFVGGSLAALSVVAGFGVMIAAPFVGGIAAGVGVAGLIHGTVGVICGVIAGFAAAGISGSIGMIAGLAVMAAGSLAAGVVGAAVGGAVKLAGLPFKAAGKLLGLGRGKKKAVVAAPTVHTQQESSAFKTASAKPSFDDAVTPAAKNDNAAPVVPQQKPAEPKIG